MKPFISTIPFDIIKETLSFKFNAINFNIDRIDNLHFFYFEFKTSFFEKLNIFKNKKSIRKPTQKELNKILNFLIKRLNRTTIFISQNGTAIIFEELVPMKKNERLRIIELKNKLHNF